MKSLFSWNFLQKLTKKRGIVPLAPTISPTTSTEASQLTIYISGRQHSLKCAMGTRCRTVCTVVQQGEIESIPASSYESTIVHSVFRGLQADQEDMADVVPGSARRRHLSAGAAHIQRSGRGFNKQTSESPSFTTIQNNR
ncbi:hypothetical protein ANN_00459 [Periplaneta americana]|uniref:Uncharacterized protein n=1 Tax=Periplaneta americana TaxID=6978 RepID=A0ABQ8TQV0_PERAM|nr:hypothetical protein ANN_00459 [Periplaneta americana]